MGFLIPLLSFRNDNHSPHKKRKAATLKNRAISNCLTRRRFPFLSRMAVCHSERSEESRTTIRRIKKGKAATIKVKANRALFSTRFLIPLRSIRNDNHSPHKKKGKAATLKVPTNSALFLGDSSFRFAPFGMTTIRRIKKRKSGDNKNADIQSIVFR